MALNFPAKIYQILENESNDIIRWLPNGAAFRIVDHGRFEREIIPKYFRHNQISSVQRQLNLYGFKCVSRGEDKGAFFHPKFRRGDWEIVKKITRYAPIRKPDEDPTKPDDFIDNANSSSNMQSSSSTSTMPNIAAAPHLLYQHHISAHAFQSYANTYHRPYDPFGYNEIPPFPPQQQNVQQESSNNTQSVFTTTHRPPAWAWNGGPVPAQYAYLHMQSTDSQRSNNNVQSISSNGFEPSTNSSNTQTMSPTVQISTSDPTVMSTSSTPSVPSVNAATTNTYQTQKNSYVNVVQDVVTIDPDFDLDGDFDFFHEVVKEFPSKMETKELKPKTCEVGVNTDISQASLLDFYAEL